MRANKLLVIDDKPKSDTHSTEAAIVQLNEFQRTLVVHRRDVSGLWKEEGDDVRLETDFSGYRCIFIHDSFNEPIIDGGLKDVLIQKLQATSMVILFSGDKTETTSPKKETSTTLENVSWYLLRRSQYFNNLPQFIDSLVIFGDYQIEYLYDRYRDPMKDKAETLADEVRGHLEISPQEAAGSEAFFQLLRLLGHQDNKNISERFSRMKDEEFLAWLDKLTQYKKK